MTLHFKILFSFLSELKMPPDIKHCADSDGLFIPYDIF